LSRATLVRALLAFAVLACSLYLALTRPAHLGLDLRGGSQIVLETSDSPTVKADRASTDRALEVLRKRIDALGVSEPAVTRSGDRRIIVELPDLQDPTKAVEAIGRTAQLTAHAVIEAGTPGLPATDEQGQPVRLGPALLTGADIGDAGTGIDTYQNWYVTIGFHGKGGKIWEQATAKAACAPTGDPARRLAFVLDGKVISSPQVVDDVSCQVGIAGGSTQITGSFDREEAKDLAALIKGGALPVPVKVIEQRVVGPTLGQAAIDASWKAALIGIALTASFIVIVYRLVGFLAAVALGCYALISYAALVALGATLTLPGLAGFVLAIGMAIDANVLVFERAREEYAAGRGLRAALTTGFRKAWSAIADSNMTTLLAGGLLFYLASGPVRGFGVTLSIGVLASMVSALLITRVLAETTIGLAVKRPRLSGLASTGRVRELLERRQPDVMGRRRIWLAVSGLALVLAVTGIATRGLNYGVEFTGGRLVEYSTSRPINVDVARADVAAAGFPNAVVQTSDGSKLSVRTSNLTNAEEKRIASALARDGGQVTRVRDELIGPSLGSELRKNAIIALTMALLAQLIYLAVRFRWTFGAGAVLAMFHDTLIVTGMFAWLGKPIDGVFLAALLTVIGYSVNDSVVVFDRVRELRDADRAAPFAGIANRAALQTVPRTVNTGIGAVFILTALALLGGDSLTDFAIALLIGIGVGTWSSVFTATPLAVIFESRSRPPTPRRAAVRREGSGAVV
jgi:SecD/SecF fusion protein